MKETTFKELAETYCERQESTVEDLRARLQAQREDYNSEGFMLLECHMLDSSRRGDLTILGFGGEHTHQKIPKGAISPRGLASDMSSVIMWCPAASVERVSDAYDCSGVTHISQMKGPPIIWGERFENQELGDGDDEA